MAVNSMEKVEMESTNTVETERGLVNIRAYILCLHLCEVICGIPF